MDSFNYHNCIRNNYRDNFSVIKGNNRKVLIGHNMKKIILLLIFMAALSGYAQEIVYTNQVTVTWDEVTTLTDGSLIPEDDVVTYEVYRNDELMDEIDLPPYTMTIMPEVTTRVGVKAKRVTAVYGEVTQSGYLWSDVDGVPNPWVVRSVLPPENVENVRIE